MNYGAFENPSALGGSGHLRVGTLRFLFHVGAHKRIPFANNRKAFLA
jgi:hypothetical protein